MFWTKDQRMAWLMMSRPPLPHLLIEEMSVAILPIHVANPMKDPLKGGKEQTTTQELAAKKEARLLLMVLEDLHHLGTEAGIVEVHHLQDTLVDDHAPLPEVGPETPAKCRILVEGEFH